MGDGDLSILAVETGMTWRRGFGQDLQDGQDWGPRPACPSCPVPPALSLAARAGFGRVAVRIADWA